MDTALVRKIKKVVADNFDQSFSVYDEFERQSGFFADLARALADFSGITPGSRLLDLGCGSGASSRRLAEAFDCRVVGLDLSPAMVEYGRRSLSDPRVRLLVGDACDPASALAAAGDNESFDAALYNASIFIMPEVEKSLAAAAACLKPGGIIGFSFYPELLGPDGRDLFALAFDRSGRPRPKKQTITSYDEALNALAKCCPEICQGSYERPYDEAFLTAFFSIPAQSASLFPRLDYAARKTEGARLFAGLRPVADQARIVWRLAAGKTAPEEKGKAASATGLSTPGGTDNQSL